MSIHNIFLIVKDQRKANGKRYSVSSVLALVLAGLLSGKNTLAAIHRWGSSLSKMELKQLGFYGGKLTSYSNLTLILRWVEPDDLAKVALALKSDVARTILNTDGKFLKGSDTFGNKEQSQIMTMFCELIGATVGLEKIEGRNEKEAMLKLLKKSDIKDAIITADAAFTQEAVLEEIINNGADFAISLKGNEPNLLHYTQKAFENSYHNKLEVRNYKEDIDCVHGRIEERHIEVIDMPYEYSNGHRHIKQLCKVTRTREKKNTPSSLVTEVAYMVTSLDKNYSPEDLLKINRGHWSCENNLNWVKDNVFAEDTSTISIGFAPIVMSLLRSLSIQIIRTISRKITATRDLFNNKRSLLWRKLATNN